ncbi:hypothetical protein [Rathayibacter sp. VKM Ac-2630]|uniref:hypothetical protein n=1 Tax=Rathayibacter sp. VKM Ac-2630 TaxID=1938617 RepID=UPI001115A6E1|nr:hypothetical protein [Rathayibacter sp. VKM Ac-2630]
MARDAIAALVLATALVVAGIAASYSVVVVAMVAPELVLSFVAPDQRDVELAVLAVLAIPLALAARLPLSRAAPAEPAAAGGSAT